MPRRRCPPACSASPRSGGTAVPATISDAGDTTGKGNSDDGLFDATYSFLVPATLTTGTLEVAAGSFTGAEFTLYTAESGTTTLDVSAPATLALSFPAPVAEAAQSTPPWVGQPDPPTSAASTSAPGSHGSGGSSRSHGFPIWVAIVILLVVAVGVVLVERRRRSRRLAAASATASAPTCRRRPAPPAAPSVDATSSCPSADDTVGAYPSPTPRAAPSVERTTPEGRRPSTSWARDEFVGLAEHRAPASSRRSSPIWSSTTHHHLSADQIRSACGPSGSKRPTLSRKTIHNYALRAARLVGAEHLPDAQWPGGYLVEGIATDWAASSA